MCLYVCAYMSVFHVISHHVWTVTLLLPNLIMICFPSYLISLSYVVSTMFNSKSILVLFLISQKTFLFHKSVMSPRSLCMPPLLGWYHFLLVLACSDNESELNFVKWIFCTYWNVHILCILCSTTMLCKMCWLTFDEPFWQPGIYHWSWWMISNVLLNLSCWHLTGDDTWLHLGY